MMKLYILIVIMVISSQEQDANSSDVQLYVGGLFELSEHWWSSYVNFFPTVVRLALDLINNRSDILEGYHLNLIVKDTKGKPGLAARKMMEMLTQDPAVVAILGPGLSDELTITGQIAPFFNMLEMSYTATTSATVDRDLFPTLFRVNQIQDDLNPVRIALIKHFGWTNVGTLLFQDDVFISQMNFFHSSLKDNGMNLLTSAVIADKDGITEQLRRLKQYDVRIFIGAFRGSIAPYVFCEVYKQGLYGSRYVWILDGAALYDTWIDLADESQIPCTKANLREAANGLFTLNFQRTPIHDNATTSGLTPTEFDDEITRMVSLTPYKPSRSNGWLFDSVWALMLGLNNSLKYLNDSSLRDYSNTPYYLDAFKTGLREVDFDGVSGPVAFDERGGRQGFLSIHQNLNNTMIQIGIFEQKTSTLTWLVPMESLWPGTNGVAPRDVFTYRYTLTEPSKSALIIIVILNTAGCGMAICLLAFNIHFRTNTNIKMSSPYVNNIILCGALLLYTAVYIMAVDYSNYKAEDLTDYTCMFRGWLLSVGFTSLFGALFSKTWRVHLIFRQEARKRIIRDAHLFAVIGVLLVVDCVVLVLWTAIHKLVKVEVIGDLTKGKQDHNMVMKIVYRYCYEPHQAYWYAVTYVYKGLLLAFGTFLAWETRSIKVTALNDSKEIGFCVYTVVILCIFGVPLSHVLPIEQPTLSFVMMSSFVIFCTTLCLIILFVPKIRLRHQTGDRRFVNSIHISTSVVPSTSKSLDRLSIPRSGSSKQVSLEETSALARPNTIDETSLHSGSELNKQGLNENDLIGKKPNGSFELNATCASIAATDIRQSKA